MEKISLYTIYRNYPQGRERFICAKSEKNFGNSINICLSDPKEFLKTLKASRESLEKNIGTVSILSNCVPDIEYMGHVTFMYKGNHGHLSAKIESIHDYYKAIRKHNIDLSQIKEVRVFRGEKTSSLEYSMLKKGEFDSLVRQLNA